MIKAQNAKIGILGGSFDPAHRGHLTISKIAIKKVKLKKIYWVVTKKNPFKNNTYFTLEERMTQARKVTKNVKKIQVLYLDEIVKSSRMIDIINFMFKKKKYKNLYLIVGSDILLKFHKWKSWKKIVNLTKFIVFSRRGYDKKSKESAVAKFLNKNKITYIKNKPIQISSTFLRKKFKIN